VRGNNAFTDNVSDEEMTTFGVTEASPMQRLLAPPLLTELAAFLTVTALSRRVTSRHQVVGE
jgi:hypothetical protein